MRDSRLTSADWFVAYHGVFDIAHGPVHKHVNWADLSYNQRVSWQVDGSDGRYEEEMWDARLFASLETMA